MKSGLTLSQMAAELERRSTAKRDFMADTRQITVLPDASIQIGLREHQLGLDVNPTFRGQMNAHYKVPQEYSERIRKDHPELYARTFNTFLTKEPAKRMVRTLDGHARAFLSDRYRPLDDSDLAEAVLPELMQHDSIQIVSTQFTESRFYLKALLPKIETEVKRGDVVQMGLVVSNSEVGAGALSVMPLIYRLICLNGAIAEDYGQRRFHVGKRASSEEAAYELYTDNTKRLDDAAFFSKVRDTVKGVLTHEVLERLTAKMREATEQRLEGTNIQEVIEVTAKKFGYGEKTKQGILRHLIEGADLTRYGLMNAITRQSQDEEDYEVATALERDGGRIIELPRQDWKAIGEAALAKAA